MSQDHTERARAHWNATHATPEVEEQDNFFSHPLVHAYVSLRAFGTITGQLDAIVVQLRQRTRPGDEILSVGCGLAGKERIVASALPDRRFVAIDIADRTIATARAQIEAEGLRNLHVELGDFNALDLEPGRYAAILGLGSIHHIETLEDFWRQCRRGLRPGGCVMAQEYIGPDRFQWTQAQCREGTRVLRELVPREHQLHHTVVERVPLAEIIAVDPSEAVRSSAIMPTLRASELHLAGFVGTGCSLLQPVLMYQIRAFDPRNWQHNLVLVQLFAEEDRLLAAGVLDHDFGMFLAERRD